MPSLTFTSLPGRRNTVLTLQVVFVVDTGRADDVLVLGFMQLVPDCHDLLISHEIARNFVLSAAHINLRVTIHGFVSFLKALVGHYLVLLYITIRSFSVQVC